MAPNGENVLSSNNVTALDQISMLVFFVGLEIWKQQNEAIYLEICWTRKKEILVHHKCVLWYTSETVKKS